MSKTTARVKGPRTVYGPKVAPAESVLLTDLGKRILAGADARTGKGKSNVVEHLLRCYGGTVTAEDFAPVTDDESEPVCDSQSSSVSVTTRRRSGEAATA